MQKDSFSPVHHLWIPSSRLALVGLVQTISRAELKDLSSLIYLFLFRLWHKVKLLDLVIKNTEHPVKFEFQIRNEVFFYFSDYITNHT